MKILKEKMFELAEQAGFGTQLNGFADDGIHCNRYEKELWGGKIETMKLMAYTQLLCQYMQTQKEMA